MKRMIAIVVLVLLFDIAGANAGGMLSLFADQSAGNCGAMIGYCEPVPLYLLYVRGTGPEITNGVGFRLLKSTAGAMFMAPEWSGASLAFGSLEAGMDLVFNAGQPWCSGEADITHVGTIPVINFSDPDTFTVAVVDQPFYQGIVVILCQDFKKYYVSGGTFVFNGPCHSPEDPFGEHVAVAQSSWGAIKDLFR
jgi:hypothetical protein